VLLLEGALDTLTPLGDAQEAASAFPHAQLLSLPGTGHEVAFSPQSQRCVRSALVRFLAHLPVKSCAPPHPAVAISPIAPTDLAGLQPWPRVPGRVGRTLHAVIETVGDVELTNRSRSPRTGLRGGTFVAQGSTLRLNKVVYVPGVSVSGTYAPRARTGVLRVTGAGASGTIVFRKSGGISGKLAGRPLPKGVHQ